MNTIKLDISNASVDFSEAIKKEAYEALSKLHKGTGDGSDFLGWLDLPSQISQKFLQEIQDIAKGFQQKCDVVVVVGIGGSYLGAKAVIAALSNSFDYLHRDRKFPLVVYAGQNISEDYLYELQDVLKDRRFGIVSISKSGTTTEPALAFRLLRSQLEEQVGKEASRSLIVAVTDKSRGALKVLADKEDYKTFVIEDNVGGRYSVLSPVGLLPIAIAGFDIEKLVCGARMMEQQTSLDKPFEENLAMIYAAARNILYRRGKKVEILANFSPKLHFFSEWWKQLYGESEGKDNKGIFPASVDFTTDLHSMGQYIQDGERMLFETVISVEKTQYTKLVPIDADNLDGLNFLAGKNIDFVNKKAEQGTMLAHIDGGVENIQISMPEINEYHLGELIYFFEKACGISGYMLGVNPFDQPGVEAYKKNMFALLDKPGYEMESQKIKARVNS